MQTNDRVETEHGLGTILTQESNNGVLSGRYCVRLDNCPDDLLDIQSKNGGVYLLDSEMELE